MAGLTAMNFLARGAILLQNVFSTHRESVKYCLVDKSAKGVPTPLQTFLPKKLTDVGCTHIAVCLVSHCLSVNISYESQASKIQIVW